MVLSSMRITTCALAQCCFCQIMGTRRDSSVNKLLVVWRVSTKKFFPTAPEGILFPITHSLTRLNAFSNSFSLSRRWSSCASRNLLVEFCTDNLPLKYHIFTPFVSLSFHPIPKVSTKWINTNIFGIQANCTSAVRRECREFDSSHDWLLSYSERVQLPWCYKAGVIIIRRLFQCPVNRH